MSFSSPQKSTNGRMDKCLQADKLGGLLALALWAGFVSLAAWQGVFTRLASDMPAIVGFACGFGLMAYALDGGVRAWIDSRHGAVIAALAVAPIGATVAAAYLPGEACLAIATLVALPVGLVCTAATLRRIALAIRGARPSSAPAASLGARPDAT